MRRLCFTVCLGVTLLIVGNPGVQTARAHEETSCLEEGCCPTYDPNVDCWAEGHWHYNHCKSACT